MRLASYDACKRRALIDDLFNGLPPYTPAEVRQSNIAVNSSNLQATRIHAQATGQCKNALMSTNQYFAVKVDRGPQHRRGEFSEIITSELRKAMKEGVSALRYTEKIKNVSSSLVLHGAGPTVWNDPERWCGSMHALEDVLIPSRTLLSMENMEHFAVYRRYTPSQLAGFIAGSNVDPAWNKDVVNRAIEWALRQGTGTDANDYTALGYQPERLAEDIKENGAFWTTDQVATINAYDFYFTDCDDDDFGWKRRMVLDCPDVAGMMLTTGSDYAVGRDSKNVLGERGKYLYDSGDRKYASKLSEILQFQFADGSVVAPHRIKSIRGIGFLLYSVCELQNRLYCSFTEAAFEAAMQYFRSSGSDDIDRILKVNLTNRAVIPDGVQFMPQEQRWQVNVPLLMQVLNLNKETIADSSTGYNRNFGQEGTGPEKTATEITAEVNASSALVGAMLSDLYRYQKYEYIEIGRRFCIPNSRDVSVRKFRAACFERGVPEHVLNVDCWEIAVEQIMGNGNKQLAIAQAQMLLQIIDRLDPDSQRIVLRDYAFAATGDAAKTNELVPLQKQVNNDSTHDAELSAARMLLGLPMGLRQNVNHAEYCAMLLASMSMRIAQIQQRGIATSDEINGLQTTAGQTVDGQPIPGPMGAGNGVLDHIQILAQNPESKTDVKKLSDALSQVMNSVKALGQQAQQAQAAAQPQNGNGEPDPKDKAKLAMEMLKGQAKIKLMDDSHGQRTEQRDQIHQQKLAENAAKAELENAVKIRQTQVDQDAQNIETSAKIRRQAAEPTAE